MEKDPSSVIPPIAGDEEDQAREADAAKREANTCMALGAGVGALGTAAAVAGGALCPLCVVVAPGLIGIGAYKRWKLRAGSRRQA